MGEKRPNVIECLINKNSIVIIDYEKSKSGMSKCAPNNEFDLDTGVAIAWARMKNIEIPEYMFEDIKRISELDTGINLNLKI